MVLGVNRLLLSGLLALLSSTPHGAHSASRTATWLAILVGVLALVLLELSVADALAGRPRHD
jgi:hypothetical protein